MVEDKMKYERIQEGKFLSRPNRFIAEIEIEGKIEICHVKNTGRCKELLIPGVRVYVQKSENPKRKTNWDLISVYKGDTLINMDSQIPNVVVKEWIEQGNLFHTIDLLRPEVVYHNSRFDLYASADSKETFIEVKGVTLEEEGIAMFPDAPTVRGVKHIEELCRCTSEGYEAYIIFVIQMKGIRYFTPYEVRQPEFLEALKKAKKMGVHILALDCIVTKDTIQIDQEVEVRL